MRKLGYGMLNQAVFRNNFLKASLRQGSDISWANQPVSVCFDVKFYISLKN
jgi:hypothetical protein